VTPHLKAHSMVQSLGITSLAVVAPFLLVAIYIWIATHFPAMDHPAFQLGAIVIATWLGGLLFSKSAKAWPTLEGLIYLYWIALPISLIVASFIFSVYITGNGP